MSSSDQDARWDRVAAPRRFVLWREAPLRAALEESGWVVETVAQVQAKDQPRLGVYGSRR